MKAHRFLRKWLYAPLWIATVLAFFLAWIFPLEGYPLHGLFLHLSAEFAVLIVTVFYVERILRRHDELRWAEADTLIADRISRIGHSVGTIYRTTFKLDSSILQLTTDDPHSMRLESSRLAEHVLTPMARTKIKQMDSKDWESFARQLGTVSRLADSTLSIFGIRMRPEIYAKVVQIQKHIDSVLAGYYIFPDILGVPDEKLPQSTRPDRDTRETKRAYETLAGEASEHLLSSVSELLKIL